jgi:hypothetical protein
VDPAGAVLLGALLRFAFDYRLARLAACGAVARAAAAAFERHADVYYGQGVPWDAQSHCRSALPVETTLHQIR